MAAPPLHTARFPSSVPITRNRLPSAGWTLEDEHFRSAIENASDLITILSPEGTILYESPSITSILGYAPDEVFGRNAFDFVHPEDAARMREHLGSVVVKPGTTEAAEFRFCRQDGSWRLLESLGKTLDPHSAAEGVVINSRDITERKQVEETLRLQKAVLEAQGEASIDGILVVSRGGEILSFNRRFVEMWEIPAEAIELQSDRAAIGSVLAKLVDPDGFIARVEYLYEHPDERSRDEILLRDGRVFDRYSAPVHSSEGDDYGRVWFFRDVTERKEAEKQLRASEESYRSLFDALAELVYILDLEGRFLNVNQAVLRTYGYSMEEMIGQTPTLIADPERADSAHVAQCFREALNGKPQRFEQWCRRKNGSVFPKETVLTRSTYFGRDVLIAVARDMTQRKQAEAAQNVAKDEAERANRAKSEFLSRMSHELRTPMNGILGFAQLMKMGELPAVHQKSVEHILKAGHHLLKLINEVLDLARIEAGRERLSLEPVPVGSVLREAIALVRPTSTNQICELEREIRGDPDSHVQADRQRLTQVLLNLLSNAVKYNRPGGRVWVSCEPTALETSSIPRLRIGVHDTGGGIPPERMDDLFVPFARLGAEQTEVEGTGLGLALSRRLVEVMGGTLAVESTVGVGSTFWVTLPRASDPLERHREESGKENERAVDLRPARVLYIEDNLANLQLVEAIFVVYPDIELIPALQGRLGIELAREHVPDLVLLDQHLPDLGGEEVLHRLRDDRRTHSIPVVMISADATECRRERLLAAGVQAYLTKPLDVAEFLATVREVLGS